MVVKRKDDIGPAVSADDSMGTPFAFDTPTNPEQRGEYAPRLGARPKAHAAAKEIVPISG